MENQLNDELKISLHELTECISEITNPTQEPQSLTELGQNVVQALNQTLLDAESGVSSASLIRFFSTLPYGRLPTQPRAFVDANFPTSELEPDTKCLTLMGTVGDEPEWCDVEQSTGHQAIPLVNAEGVKAIPMVSRLITELGLEVEQVLEPAAAAIELANKDFNVLHVEDALGSAHIPAQESFVVPKQIKSVVGFGTMLPTGHLCVVLVFSKLRISRETADLFRSLALGVRIAALAFMDTHREEPGLEAESYQVQLAARDQLLAAFRNTVSVQSNKLEGTLAELHERNAQLTGTLMELQETRVTLQKYEKGMASEFARQKLNERGTYKVAFVVGTLINLYGHFLVPYLRGREDIAANLLVEFQQRPVLNMCSILIAYMLPIGVQVVATVKAKLDETHSVKAPVIPSDT